MSEPYVDKSIIPLRQVHLDFHTSPDIPGIGKNFSKKQFQAALKKGNVQSITVFAKCHHGYCYYPTGVGKMHPHLDFDLLGEMIDAAHEIGVRAPIYITAGWSELDADEHPEWLARRADGTPFTNYDFKASPETPKPMVSWKGLCLNDGSYCKHIYELTEEICKRYKDIDGIFYDIVFIGENNTCCCDECRAGMKKSGLDPEKPNDVAKYYVTKRNDFTRKCREIIEKYHKGATIFFNSGGAELDKPEFSHCTTHFEMEDLPTAWGGYNKLPPRAKYFSLRGKYYLGMTGKFHSEWGEFGGFKPKEALKYEAAKMAIYGAGISIGDHLYPDGLMDEQTYENIGYAFDYVEKIQPFCYGGEYVNNLGVYFTPNVTELYGISDILLEDQIDYRFVTDNDYKGLDTVIFPSGITLDDDGVKALNGFIAGGGRVLLIGNALLKDGKFQIDIGARYVSAARFDCDYILPSEGLLKLTELPKTPFLAYTPSVIIESTDAEVCAEVCQPYFSRTYGHFCGHRNTPYDKSAERSPALIKKGNIAYISHDIPRIYKEHGSIFHRRYLLSALKLLGYRPLFKLGLGSCGRATLLHQDGEKRYCLNMTYASPLKRGNVEIIDEILPVYNINAEIRVPERISRVYNALNGKEYKLEQADGMVSFTVDEFSCHTAIVLEYR